MPGIIVGVDGSGHSQRALEWAMKEAAIRHQPLTVLTVHNAVAGYNGGVAVYSDDPARTEQGREASSARAARAASPVCLWDRSPARSASTRTARSSSFPRKIGADGRDNPARRPA